MSSTAVPSTAGEAPVHSAAYRTRRFLNWFPLGLTYAFLYMGRYNLTVSKSALGSLMTKEDFGIIFGAGTLVYAFAFLFNGPFTDRIGGKRAMLIAAVGAGLSNLAMGLYIQSVVAAGSVNNATLRLWFSILYTANMYFQSFGAVAIVKVNASWFHVRERGSFSGIFGTMIASGIFMAFTVNAWLLGYAKAQIGGSSDALATKWVFFAPSALLLGMAVLELFLLKDRPGQAGHQDFDTGDASSGEAEDVPVRRLMVKIITNPIILTVALIEMCTGLVRQGVMQWYPIYAESVLSLPGSHALRNGTLSAFWRTAGPFLGAGAVLFFIGRRLSGRARAVVVSLAALVALAPFLQGGWGGLLFVAGVIGSNVAGTLSDLIFGSRRAPVAGFLYGLLGACAVVMALTLGTTRPVVAHSSVPELQPGDQVVEIAGVRDPKDWVAVSEAFAAVPATCQGGATWDTELHLCSSEPRATDPSLSPSTGAIRAVVERGGQRVELQIKDPAPTMRAGDRRVLKATPEATRNPYLLGALVFVMSICVIGTHGVLSGTATMDFGGRKGAATAVGMIDGFVYLGTAIQAVSLGYLTTRDWAYWPWFLVPFCALGLVLCTRIWDAKPQPRGQAASAAALPATAGGATRQTSTGT